MGNSVFLNIETNYGIIRIPFVGLRELDYFTVGYADSVELVNSLIKMLNLSILYSDVLDMYITGDKYTNNGNSSLSCIKYRDDNYDMESVKNMLSLFLRQDHRRIRYCDVRHVKTEGMIRFNGGMTINDREIDLAINSFLKDRTGMYIYKKVRDMYFLVKDFGGIKINKLYDGASYLYDINLSKTESREDDFYQYLIEYSSNGENEFEKAIDELSRMELENIKDTIENRNLFDGIKKEDDELTEDMYALESLTGMSIASLKKINPGFDELPERVNSSRIRK